MSQETAEFSERARCIACGSSRLLNVCSGSYSDDPVRGYIASDPWGDDPLPYLQGQRWEYVRCAECQQAFHRYVLTPKWNEIRFTRWMTQAAIAEFEAKVDTPQRRLRKACDNAAHALRLERLTRTLRAKSAAPRILDFGCGYGEFLAMCSQFGFEAIGIDRSTARRENSKHTRIFAEIDDLRAAPEGSGFHALTLFEVLEHLDDPAPLLQQLSGFLVDGGILVLETPDCSGVTAIASRSDYLEDRADGAHQRLHAANSRGLRRAARLQAHRGADRAGHRRASQGPEERGATRGGPANQADDTALFPEGPLKAQGSARRTSQPANNPAPSIGMAISSLRTSINPRWVCKPSTTTELSSALTATAATAPSTLSIR